MKIFTHLLGFVALITICSCSSQNKIHRPYKDYRNDGMYSRNNFYPNTQQIANNGRYIIAPGNINNKNAVSRYPTVFNNSNAVAYYVLPETYYQQDGKINATPNKVIVLNNDGSQGKTYIVIKGNNNNVYRPPYIDNKKNIYNNYDRNYDYRNDNRRDDNVIIIVQ